MRKDKMVRIFDWALIIVICGFIFSTLDILPAVWNALRFIIGDGVNFIPVVFIGSVLGFFLFYTLAVKKQKHLQSYIWFGILVVCIYFAYKGIEGPYDKMHLFEYFIMSFVLFRVLHHYIVSTKLYFLGAIFTLVVAVVDETMQGFSPTRVFSFADLGADFVAATLGQISIALIIKPKLEIWRFTLKSKIKRFHAQEEWLRKQR